MADTATPKKQVRYTTEKYWFLLFPILICAVVAVWLLLVLYYPFTRDLGRAALNSVQAGVGPAATATATVV